MQIGHAKKLCFVTEIANFERAGRTRDEAVSSTDTARSYKPCAAKVCKLQ